MGAGGEKTASSYQGTPIHRKSLPLPEPGVPRFIGRKLTAGFYQSTFRSVDSATVKVGGYTIPLLGIPTSATEERCDYCDFKGHLTELHLTPFGHIACADCLGVILQVTANLDDNSRDPS